MKEKKIKNQQAVVDPGEGTSDSGTASPVQYCLGLTTKLKGNIMTTGYEEILNQWLYFETIFG